MKLSIVDLFRNALRRRDAKYRKQLFIFLLCLVISVFVWFMLKLSSDYQSVIPIKIHFTNIPGNKTLTGMTDTTVTVSIKEKGTELLRIKYISRQQVAEVNLRNIRLARSGDGYRGYVLSSSLISPIENALGLTGRIESIYPDTLFVFMEDRASQRVPVTLDITTGFKAQYMLYGKIALDPDTVTVTGPGGMIRSVREADIGKINLTNLDQTVTVRRQVIRDSNQLWINYSPGWITVTIPVEKFTEAVIELPVNMISDSSGMRIKTFPETVKVTYNIAIKDFGQITSDMFEAAVSLDLEDLSTSQSLRVNLLRQPPLVRVTKIEPDKVEFIILP